MDIKIICADITTLKVDVIVNAANTSLLGGGGVDGYKLPAEYVIHTPGPIYQDGNHGEPELLSSCYRNSLILATDFHCKTIAFPCISAGVYGYPMEEAAVIALSTVYTYLTETKTDMTVYHVCFNQQTENIYRMLLSKLDKNC